MRIINRAEFLKLPKNTVYSEFRRYEMGELLIKGETLDNGDFAVQHIASAIDGNFCESLDGGVLGDRVRLDFDSQHRMAATDGDQTMFAVWDSIDVRQLIDRLQQCVIPQVQSVKSFVDPTSPGSTAPIAVMSVGLQEGPIEGLESMLQQTYLIRGRELSEVCDQLPPHLIQAIGPALIERKIVGIYSLSAGVARFSLSVEADPVNERDRINKSIGYNCMKIVDLQVLECDLKLSEEYRTPKRYL